MPTSEKKTKPIWPTILKYLSKQSLTESVTQHSGKTSDVKHSHLVHLWNKQYSLDFNRLSPLYPSPWSDFGILHSITETISEWSGIFVRRWCI